MHAIEVSHLTKEYRLGAMQSLKQTAANVGARLLGRDVPKERLFKALDDVSFTIKPGEVVGVIGHNGAGKSTLLKMLSRISTPTSGSVTVNGRVAPLIEVGAGFVGDFTGRENVFLNGAIMGMSKKEIARKFDEIVDFAEMADFIDTPVKRYSSGMQVKLAFAVATSIESEILIVDEVLAVGDLAFQRKCFDRMEQLIKQQHRTVILVSHNIRQVERMCSRVILMDHGKILFAGASNEACNIFYTQSDEKIRGYKESSQQSAARTQSTGEIELLGIEVLGDDGKPLTTLNAGSPVCFRLTFMAHQLVAKPIIGFGFHTTDFMYLATVQSVEQIEIESFRPGRHQVTYRMDEIPFVPGVYSLRVGVAQGEFFQSLLYSENCVQVTVVDPSVNRSIASHPGEGFIKLSGTWHSDQGHLASVPEQSETLSAHPATVSG